MSAIAPADASTPGGTNIIVWSLHIKSDLKLSFKYAHHNLEFVTTCESENFFRLLLAHYMVPRPT